MGKYSLLNNHISVRHRTGDDIVQTIKKLMKRSLKYCSIESNSTIFDIYNMKEVRICKHCKSEFENMNGKVFANHVRWCKKNPERNKGLDKISKSNKESNINKYGEFKEYVVKCNNCSKEHIVKERSKLFPSKDKYFCSKSCANKRIHSKETREKISESMKKVWQDESYVDNFVNNFSTRPTIFNSKNEKLILEHLKAHYPEDEWTTGGAIRYRGTILTRDIYSKKLKVNIEYDGIWHFKDINGQLNNKRYKDNLLNEWSHKNKYRMIRISEKYFKKNVDPIKILENLIYQSKEQYKELY